jgi:hypothetical protein
MSYWVTDIFRGSIKVSPAELLLSAGLVDLSDFLKTWLVELNRPI